MHKAPKEELKESVFDFIQKYGFLGFMTALPTTADFIPYESVYLQKTTLSRQKHFPQRNIFLIFTLLTSFLYYLDYDTIDEQTCDLYRQGISAFGGISPTYRIALEKDSPVIVWNFHSLLVMAQMCFSFMLTDKDSNMRMCKH